MLYLIFSAAPYWINAPNNTNGAEDETVNFECVAGGIPAPDVEWFMNGEPIKSKELFQIFIQVLLFYSAKWI